MWATPQRYFSSAIHKPFLSSRSRSGCFIDKRKRDFFFICSRNKESGTCNPMFSYTYVTMGDELSRMMRRLRQTFSKNHSLNEPLQDVLNLKPQDVIQGRPFLE